MAVPLQRGLSLHLRMKGPKPMTQHAYITYVEAGSSEDLIIHKEYFSNPVAAVANMKEVLDYSDIKVGADDLTLDALMDRIWNQAPILKSIGRVRFNVLGWAPETKLVWAVIERVTLKDKVDA